MAVLKTENSICGALSIEDVGTMAGISTVADSTFPCANIVTAHSWPALSASLCINLCSAGHAVIALSSKIIPTSSAASAALP